MVERNRRETIRRVCTTEAKYPHQMLVAVFSTVNDKHQKEVGGKNGIYNLIYQEEIETQRIYG